MTLSNEDNLRMNVLLRQSPSAIRIDESKMIVYAWVAEREAVVQLNPTCNDSKYLKLIREMISTHVMGSPGGYPVYLSRWTRMGQSRNDDSLEKLLLLGEPEAVVAVVNSPDLTAPLGKLAWWAYPTESNGRQLLKSSEVIKTDLGKEIAAFLIEFLPFEEDPLAAIESVRLSLQPGLITDEEKAILWKRSGRKTAYLVGFLHAIPDQLPIQTKPHTDFEKTQEELADIIPSNPYARLLSQTLSPQGQAFLQTCQKAIERCPNQDSVSELMDAIGNWFIAIRPDEKHYRAMDAIEDRSRQEIEQNKDIQSIIEIKPDYATFIQQMLLLSMLSEYIVAPIFGQTDAIGTVMRKRLLPVTKHIVVSINALQNRRSG